MTLNSQDKTKLQSGHSPQPYLEFYSRAYGLSQESVFLVEPETYRVLYANPYAAATTGYQPQDLARTDFRNLFAPVELSAIEALFQSTLEWKSGLGTNRTLQKLNGEQVPIEIASLAVDLDGKKVVFCSIRAFERDPRVSISLKKVDAFCERILSKRGSIPTVAVRKALSWLISVPIQTLYDRLGIQGQGGEIEVDARILETLFDGFERVILKTGAQVKSFSIDTLLDSSQTVHVSLNFAQVLPDLERLAGDLETFKQVLENRFNAQMILSYPDKGVSQLRVSLFSKDEKTLSDNRVTCAGLFSSPELKAEIEKEYLVKISSLAILEALPEKSFYLADIAGLKRLQEHLTDFKSYSKWILMDQPDSQSSLHSFFSDTHVQHWIPHPGEISSIFFKATTNQLQNSGLWGLEPYLGSGAAIETLSMFYYADKPIIIRAISDYIFKLNPPELSTGDVLRAVDELIQNAFFDAPRDAYGLQKYYHLSRTDEKLALKPHESPFIRYGASEKLFAISVEDPFGSLSYEAVTKAIFLNATGGLFKIFQQCQGFVVRCKPGSKTEVIVLFSIDGSTFGIDSNAKSKCFSYFS